ncbi:MAG: MBOAT family protein [Phycisphaerales bacterium]|nr:MBOAT family protein [Phycisphaerales bacterium]
MIFTTVHFILFFAAVFPLLFMLPKRGPARLWFLLITSYYFYMCSVPWYITVIIGITLVDYAAGLLIERASTPARKRAWLGLSIATNFGVLVAFKYTGFMAENINAAFDAGFPVPHIVLPLGVSFHTFQAVSYTIEVCRGRVPAERSLLRYAIYVAFFPQMVAGPIERPHNLLPQLHAGRELSFDRFRSGFVLVLWGAFKKLAVADLVSPAVNTVYAAPQQFSGPLLALATFLFAVQIYCDFSGYTDIAIGVARMMGFDLMTNFRQPYLAPSIGEFWRRWHISLSTWFRDYLYIPLGGNRVGTARRYANIMIVFLVSGLWHGANWTFAVWGGLHGAYMVIGSLTAGARARLWGSLGVRADHPALALGGVLRTFALVMLAWVFFRAATVRDGVHIVRHMADLRGFRVTDLFTLNLPRFEMAVAFTLIGAVAGAEFVMVRRPAAVMRAWSWRPARWACYTACALGTVFFGVFEGAEFIYFQF